MKINRVKTANGDYNYYLAKSVRKNGKVSTVNLESLGKHSELLKKYDDPFKSLKEYAKKKTLEEKIESGDFNYKVTQQQLSEDGEVSQTNLKYVGHFYLTSIIEKLGLKSFFNELKSNLKIKYNPYEITKHLIVDRIMHPRSKFGTYNHLHEYYGAPSIKLQNIYKPLDLIAANLDSFQSALYHNSNSILKRNTKVLYYDCTNFYFETNKTDGIAKYGLSKDGKSKPLVGLGLFMDGDGIPLAFDVHSGNTNEQTTVLPLEKQIIKDFDLSNFIYISDAGLNSNNIRSFNSFQNRNFIVTESLKKLSDDDLKIVFNDNPWYLLGDKSNKPHFMKDIIELETKDPDEVIKNVYYKDFTINKPVKVGLEEATINNRVTNKTTFNQRLIVTYRPKYKLYQAAIRAGQVERANEIINKKTYTRKRANDPNRFIELGLDHDKVDLNIDTIAEEAKFDGYYGLVTSLFEDGVEDILKVSGYRWKIEDNMRTLKMHLKTRPIHHSLDERITGHLAICFTALLVIRLLEKLLNNEYPTGDILKQLKSMKVNPLNLSIYNSTYTGSELLTKLDKTFNKNLSMTTFTNLQLNKYKRN